MTSEEALKFLISIPNLKKVFSCCGGNGGSRWVIDKSQWECTDCGAPQSNDPNYLYSPQNNGYVPKTYTNTASYLPKKCECGSSAVGSDKHSDYCSKYGGK